MKVAQLFESVPRLLYHLTMVKNLPSIRQNGLTASSGDWKHITYKPTVFAVTSNTPYVIDQLLIMMVGKLNVNMDEWDDQQYEEFQRQFVLLTIDVNKCKIVSIRPDPNADPDVHSVQVTGVIPPEAIVDVASVQFDQLT